MYEASGEMTIKDVVCPVYIPRYTSQVMGYLYAFEGDNQHVSKASPGGEPRLTAAFLSSPSCVALRFVING